jgi:predicted PurR-regulated permease PerM
MSEITRPIKIDSSVWIQGALVVFGVFLVWKAWSILVLVLTAVVLAIFIETIAQQLSRFRIPRTPAVIIVFAVSLVLFGYLIYSLIPVFITELANLKKILPQVASIEKFANVLTGGQGESLLSVDPKVFISRIQGSVAGLSSSFAGFLGAMFGNIANVLLLTVLSLYLALEDRAIERLLRAVIPAQREEYAVSLWIRVRSKVESWFRGQLFIALITALVTYAGLLIIGIPNAPLLGLVAGIFGMVPFGIFVALIPAGLLAFFHGGPLTLLYVVLLYWLLQQLLDYVVSPLIVRRATGVPSLVIIISFVLSITLIGFLGFFLAIPIAILLLELVSDFEKQKYNELVPQSQEEGNVILPSELDEIEEAKM